MAQLCFGPSTKTKLELNYSNKEENITSHTFPIYYLHPDSPKKKKKALGPHLLNTTVHRVCTLLRDTHFTSSKIVSIQFILLCWQKTLNQQGEEGRKEEKIFSLIS